MNNSGNYRSRLFTLRLWIEPNAPRPGEFRCQVQDLQSGEVRYFGEWAALIVYLNTVFTDDDDDAPHRHCPDKL